MNRARLARVYSARRGVSLIELLIVIAIIAVLIALIIPAINMVRGAAYRAQNQNNIRQILIGIQAYANSNNGKLPASDFPYLQNQILTLGNCANYNYTYNSTTKQYTQNWSGCDGLINAKSVTGGVTTSITENPAKARDNWKDGPFHFLILPFMGYENVWNKSYGVIGEGKKYKYYDDGTVGCPCTEWDWDGNCTKTPVCHPASWVHKDEITMSNGANKGWQAGRVYEKIGVYMGVGDPTILSPGYAAPVSYPLFASGANVSDLSTVESLAYTPMISEAYVSCAMQSGTYNSWAASHYNDLDWDPIPAQATTWSVGGSDGKAYQYGYVWSGIFGDGTPGGEKKEQWEIQDSVCGSYYCPYNSVYGDKFNMWVNDNIVSKLPGATSQDKTYYVNNYVNNGQPKPTKYWTAHDPASQQRVRTNGTTYLTNPITYRDMFMSEQYFSDPWYQEYYGCNTTPKPENPECHPGEWGYGFDFTAQSHNFFQDRPRLTNNSYYYGSEEVCQTGRPQTFVPGALNLGMLDGSVKSIPKSIDPAAWNALIKGQPPTTDW